MENNFIYMLVIALMLLFVMTSWLKGINELMSYIKTYKKKEKKVDTRKFTEKIKDFFVNLGKKIVSTLNKITKGFFKFNSNMIEMFSKHLNSVKKIKGFKLSFFIYFKYLSFIQYIVEKIEKNKNKEKKSFKQKWFDFVSFIKNFMKSQFRKFVFNLIGLIFIINLKINTILTKTKKFLNASFSKKCLIIYDKFIKNKISQITDIRNEYRTKDGVSVFKSKDSKKRKTLNEKLNIFVEINKKQYSNSFVKLILLILLNAIKLILLVFLSTIVTFLGTKILYAFSVGFVLKEHFDIHLPIVFSFLGNLSIILMIVGFVGSKYSKYFNYLSKVTILVDTTRTYYDLFVQIFTLYAKITQDLIYPLVEKIKKISCQFGKYIYNFFIGKIIKKVKDILKKERRQ